MFSIREIFDLAIQIEKNGETVYRNALQKISNPSLVSLLQWLADEEVQHAEQFSELKQAVGGTADDPRLEEMGKGLLQGILGNQTFSLQDVDFSRIEHIEALLKLTIEFEKDTVLFYEMIGAFIEDEETLTHLKTIIQEENRHVQGLQEFLDSGDAEPPQGKSD
jgi:rubrerythrin